MQRSYRTELDGLRAFAVLAVLVNHLEGSWLPGGFLGVDSFFCALWVRSHPVLALPAERTK